MQIAAVIGTLVFLVPIAFIAYINVGGIRKAIKDSRAKLAEKLCAIDADCPPGYVCQEGRCIPVSR